MPFTRRDFLKVSAAASVAMSAPAVHAAKAGKKYRTALIGSGWWGKVITEMAMADSSVEMIAVCDVDQAMNEEAVELIRDKAGNTPKIYKDYRELLEKEKPEICIVATPDHSHYPAAMTALKHGKAVFCEKPLAWGVQECLDLAKIVAEKQIPSQMGNQGNAGGGWREIYSIVHSDILGKVTAVKTWTNRPIWPQGGSRPQGQDKVPDSLDWNAWLGPAPMRPYKGERVYEPFVWRGWYDFGCGALGDMACHTMNAMFQVMKPDYKLTVEPLMMEGCSDEQFPKAQIIMWNFAKSGLCPGFKAYWYDGNKKPEKPEAMGKHNLPNTGSMFIGTKGVLVSASDYNDSPNVYMKGQVVKPTFEQLVKPSDGGMHGEFLKAVKGEKPWDSPMSNFTYAGKITAIINMGTIAQRVGRKITFNPKTMKFKEAKANELMARKPREGWEFPYQV